jgi:hypothetical protein
MNTQSVQKEIQEVKPIKRIGWATLIDQKKLEDLRSNWKEIFDLAKFSLQERMKILSDLGVIQKQTVFENLTPTVGFEAIVKALTGNISTVDEVGVNYHALGSGSTPAADADTELETETTRALLSSRSYNNNKAYYTAFYGLAAAIGTHNEMGLFINGSASADSGVLWDRTLLTIVKSGSQSLTIDYEDTFSNDV